MSARNLAANASTKDCHFCGEPLDDPEFQNESILRVAREHWALLVLDAWRRHGIYRRWSMTEGITTSVPVCELTTANQAPRHFVGAAADTEAAARITAAESVWDDLPNEEKATIGAKP